MGLRFPYENGADPAIVPMSYRPLLAYDGEWKCVLCKEIPSFESGARWLKWRFWVLVMLE
jgi:hypothetical protein